MTEPHRNGYRPWKIAAAMTLLGVIVTQSVATIVFPGYAVAETTLVIESTVMLVLLGAQGVDDLLRRK